jgi:hypothetical protein
MMRAIWGLVLATGLMAATAPVRAEPAKPLFASDAPIHITITAPIAKLKSARTDADAVDGSIAVVGAAPETLPVKLTARGITRRKTEICAFPPLRVEFTEKPGPNSLFAGQKKLKLVTHCQTPSAFQNFVLLEYAAYRLYNVITPQSFRARLATVDYVEADGKPALSRIGFFIEDASDMAKRNDLRELKVGARIPSATLNPVAAARFAVFEHMISNFDWAMQAGPAGTNCCHNARLIGPAGATSNYIPVPYDFDFSGLVDAPYASPPDGVPISNVRTRHYRGFCRTNVEATAAAADMLAKRPALMAVLDDIPQLDERPKKKAQAFLTGFFDQIDNDQDVASNLLKNCL